VNQQKHSWVWVCMMVVKYDGFDIDLAAVIALVCDHVWLGATLIGFHCPPAHASTSTVKPLKACIKGAEGRQSRLIHFEAPSEMYSCLCAGVDGIACCDGCIWLTSIVLCDTGSFCL
jgi:hypothetical protein